MRVVPKHSASPQKSHRSSKAGASSSQVRAQSRRGAARALRPSKALVPLLVAVSLAVSYVVAFGNPVLWVTSEQYVSSQYALGTDKRDYQFIEGVAGETGQTSEVVCLGEYKAISQDSDENRVKNIALAAQELDGWEIKPGETLSVNDALGDTSKDERYQLATVVGGTTLEKGRGGGVCQVSTALYIAAIKADLEIVQRYPHTIVSDYAPIGLDATLSYGQKDLRIKNNSDKSVFLRVTALGQTVEVKIYGTARSEHIEIDPSSKVVNRFDIPADEVYVDPAALGLAADDPITFYEAQAFRVVYRDGVVESSEMISADTYQVSPQSSVNIGEGSVDPAK